MGGLVFGPFKSDSPRNPQTPPIFWLVDVNGVKHKFENSNNNKNAHTPTHPTVTSCSRCGTVNGVCLAAGDTCKGIAATTVTETAPGLGEWSGNAPNERGALLFFLSMAPKYFCPIDKGVLLLKVA